MVPYVYDGVWPSGQMDIKQRSGPNKDDGFITEQSQTPGTIAFVKMADINNGTAERKKATKEWFSIANGITELAILMEKQEVVLVMDGTTTWNKAEIATAFAFARRAHGPTLRIVAERYDGGEAPSGDVRQQTVEAACHICPGVIKTHTTLRLPSNLGEGEDGRNSPGVGRGHVLNAEGILSELPEKVKLSRPAKAPPGIGEPKAVIVLTSEEVKAKAVEEPQVKLTAAPVSKSGSPVSKGGRNPEKPKIKLTAAPVVEEEGKKVEFAEPEEDKKRVVGGGDKTVRILWQKEEKKLVGDDSSSDREGWEIGRRRRREGS